MKRSFQSGAAKRREKKEKLMKEERGKRTLHNFLKHPCEGESSTRSQSNLIFEFAPEVVVEAFTNEDNNVIGERSYVVPLVLPQIPNHDTMDINVDHDDSDLDEDEEKNERFQDVSNDPASWKSLDKKQRELITLKGPPTTPEVLPRDNSGRPFPQGIFYKHQTNGESMRRDWLVWSEKADALFCFPCTLFKGSDVAESSKQHSQLCQSGINDKWKKLYEKVKSHESNSCHIKNYIQWKDLRCSLQSSGGIDAAMQQNIKKEEETWRKILKVVIDVVIFLAKRNLPLRGSHSTIDYHDSGLFLATLQLVGRYNADVGHHLQNIIDRRESGKRLQAHYLSWQSQNEFLELCAKEVRNLILEEVKSSHYYSIIVDGTPDMSHKEQLTLIIRYVLCQDENWEVYERFIKLSDFEKKTAADITDQIKNILNECQLDLKLCRGQGYDNASNMSGKFKGVQSRIIQENPYAYFTPCSAHSLNLCGAHAMETSVDMKSYFGNVQKLYNTFSASPTRWKILQEKARISLHSTSKTRWSARIEAVSPLAKNYQGVLSALNALSEIDLPAEAQADVNGLIEWITSYEFVFFTTVWYKLLKCIDIRNKILQCPKLCLPDASEHIKQLVSDVELIKDSWDKLVEESNNVAKELQIEPQFKITRFRKKKRFHDESNEEYVFKSSEERLKVEVFYPVFDLLLMELNALDQKLSNISRLFSPILSSKEDKDSDSDEDDPSTPTLSTHTNQTPKLAEDLASTYPADLSKEDLMEELETFFKVRKQSKIYVSGHISSALDMLNIIYKKGLQSVFPQICTALRLLMVAPVSVASGERAFSKLSLIKNRLRATTGEDRLNHLMLLSIEHETAEKLSFDNIIDDFARMKARKKNF